MYIRRIRSETGFFDVFILYTALAILLGSCGFYEISDGIPLKWPSGGLPADRGGNPPFWDISWLSAEGTVAACRVAGAEPPVLQFVREIPLVISAAPVTPDFPQPYKTKSAGFLAPSDRPRPSEIELSWEQGFAASFMLDLAEAGVFPDLVNLKRFQELVTSRGGDKPWNLDRNRLSTDLLAGELWVYSFRLLPEVETQIQLPAGEWYSEYPPDPVIIAGSGGWGGWISVGLHNFIRPSDCLSASVSVDERGAMTLLSGG